MVKEEKERKQNRRTLVEVEIEDEIKVDDVETPPDGNGGMNGDVDDWEDETDIVIPVE